jgi:hypothetical protein
MYLYVCIPQPSIRSNVKLYVEFFRGECRRQSLKRGKIKRPNKKGVLC